jgi:hypothetical protein
MSSGYIAEGSYKKAKFTPGLTYVVMDTRKRYIGFYIEDSRGRFYSGKAPGDKSVRLEKVELKVPEGLKAGLKKAAMALAAGLAAKVISSLERQKGKTKRYFVQNKTTQKISETDKATYEQAKTDLPNSTFMEVDWELTGPAEDQMFGDYKYIGAATKNKATIMAAESQMKGISTFITDYSYLVEDPVSIQKPQIDSNTALSIDPELELENDRKANFDTRI